MAFSILLVGLGSFLGGVCRYLSTISLGKIFAGTFPIATFFVNIAGCFLIGTFYGLAANGNWLSPNARLFLTVGFCGGFTTFSTFSNEILQLFRNGNVLTAALYASASVFLGVLAAWAGNSLVSNS